MIVEKKLRVILEGDEVVWFSILCKMQKGDAATRLQYCPDLVKEAIEFAWACNGNEDIWSAKKGKA